MSAVLNEISLMFSVIKLKKSKGNMLSFRNALSLMILTRTRDSNVMRNALELAQSKTYINIPANCYTQNWRLYESAPLDQIQV